MVINLNEHPISLVAFLAALLPINFVLCSHPCLLDVLLGREITRMRRSGQHHRLHPKAPWGGNPLAADRLRALRQEQPRLIESCQWVSLAANPFLVAHGVLFGGATGIFNLAVLSMQRCPCFQASAASSLSSESPEKNKANINRLLPTRYSCLSCEHPNSSNAGLFFCLTFHLCFPYVGGMHLTVLSISTCD
jgi:hypothetical protein